MVRLALADHARVHGGRDIELSDQIRI